MPELTAYVQSHLDLKWSPEQISGRLTLDYADDQSMRISAETIYKTLYDPASTCLSRTLTKRLRTGRSVRHRHQSNKRRQRGFISPDVMLDQRPSDADARELVGHWEGDLIVGTRNASAIATLVERVSRLTILVYFEGRHTAEALRAGLVEAFEALPEVAKQSLTWDQGVEMAAHRSLTETTALPVFFCERSSPWQRGTNENTNGLLRQYFPKHTDLSVYGLGDLSLVEAELNDRPRKTLGWATPAEVFASLV